MKINAIIGIILIAAGTLALIYGQFSYTEEQQAAQIGPIELTVSEQKTVNIPTWAGAGAIVAGAAFLLVPVLKR